MLNHIQVNIHNIVEQLLVQEMFCQENICMYLVMIDQRYLSEKKRFCQLIPTAQRKTMSSPNEI